MLFSLGARRIALLLALPPFYILYFFGLTRCGLLGPDEPRYAWIGRAMAQSGDWISPRLLGDPWFEKPALLYWMTAAGFRAGLDNDLAPRLPVALLSVSFLIFFGFVLEKRYGRRIAAYATLILATSAAWIALSHVGVTDIPLSVCFGTAMLLIGERRFTLAGIALGLAVLAKGLVPYTLFLPAIWYLRTRKREALFVFTTSLLVASLWYLPISLRYGRLFFDEFILKHHFGRFADTSLQHVQPWWFYLPVFLGAVFPWTPLIASTLHRGLYTKDWEKFLAAWLVYGIVFFSAFQNKLPGYLLPMLPPFAILAALSLERLSTARWTLVATAALLAIVPLAADVLPQALLRGISRAPLHFNYLAGLPVLLAAGAVWYLDHRKQRDTAMVLIGLLIVACVFQLLTQTYPVLDRTVSARTRPTPAPCVSGVTRAIHYGLNYYAGKAISDCIQ